MMDMMTREEFDKTQALSLGLVEALNVARFQDRTVVLREHRLVDILNFGISPEELSMAFFAVLGEEADPSLFHPEQTIAETSALLVRAGFERVDQ